MASYSILLDIVARDLAGGVFGQVFGNLSMLAVMGAQVGVAADGTLTPLGLLIGTLAGSGLAFAIFDEGMKTAIDDASQFQFQLARLQNATGATDAEFAGMAQNIQDVAGQSIFNTTEVAQAYTVMANNLIPVGTIISGLGQDAIILSEAMGTDAVSGAQLLTQAFKVFSDQGLTGQQMIDMLTRAFHDGMPDVAGMASLLGTAGGNADSMGVSMRDLLAVADILSPAMGSVSRAGTSLNYMLKGITDPTSKAYTEFQKLGLILQDGTNTFYDAQGNFIGLAAAIDKIKASLDGMTPEAKANALDELFNVRSGQGARILTNLTDFKDKYNKIFADLGQTGAAQEAANRLVDTWQGRLAELGTNIQSFFANVGLNIIGPLLPDLKALGDFFDMLAHNKGLDEFLGHFLLAGTVIGAFSLLVGALTVAILFLSPILVPLGLAFAAVAVGAGEVAVIWKLLEDHSKQVHEVLGLVGDVLGKVRDGLGWVRDRWDELWTVAGPVVQKLLDFAGQTASTLGPSLQQLGDSIQRIGDTIPKDQLDAFLNVLKAIGEFIGGTLLIFLAELIIDVVGYGIAIAIFFAGLVSTILAAAAFIIDTIRTIATVMEDFRTGQWSKVQSDWSAGWNSMKGDAQQAGSDIASTFQNTLAAVNTTSQLSYAIGQSMADGLANGFDAQTTIDLSKFSGTAYRIARAEAGALKFESPPKEGPLSDSDQWGGRFVDLITGGMLGKLGSLSAAVGRVAGTMASTPGMAGAQAQFAGAADRGTTIEIPIYLDGKQIADTTFQYLGGQLKAMGMSRLFK